MIPDEAEFLHSTWGDYWHGFPVHEQIKQCALKNDFAKARELLQQLMFEYGMSGEDIITQVYRETMQLDEKTLQTKDKIELINIIAEY